MKGMGKFDSDISHGSGPVLDNAPTVRTSTPVVLGSYVLISHTGSSGIGDRHLALWGVDEGIDQLREMLCVNPDVAREPLFIARFFEQGRTLARMSLPHTARVLDIGWEGATPFIVTEHIPGRSLEWFLYKVKPGDQPLVLWIFSEILRCLVHLHSDRDRAPIICGDLRPETIRLARSGDVKLMLFGETVSGIQNKGTLNRIFSTGGNYIAPEMVDGGQADRRADIFSVGATLKRAIQASFGTAGDAHWPLRGVAAEITAAVEKACAVDPRDRYQEAGEFRKDIQDVLAEFGAHNGPELLASRIEKIGSAEFAAEEARIKELVRAGIVAWDRVRSQDPDASTEMEPGSLVDNRYRIIRLIGEGGMGSVFEAEHTGLMKRVAIKVLKPDAATDPEVSERFRREARSMALLDHDGIVRVTDFGQTRDDRLYLAMELVSGITLRDDYAENPLADTRRIFSIVSGLCDALDVAHKSGVVHRDLKPENVLIDQDGNPRIMDFGIATLVDDNKTRLTTTGHVCGTVDYMSPEQIRKLELDGRSDLYSLGIILYEGLTGVTPFEGCNIVQTLQRIVDFDPKKPSEMAPDRNLPGFVDDFVMKAISKLPEDRFPDASGMKQALKEVLERLDAAADEQYEESEPDESAQPEDTALYAKDEASEAGASGRLPSLRHAPEKNKVRRLYAVYTIAVIVLVILAYFIFGPKDEQEVSEQVAALSPENTLPAPLVSQKSKPAEKEFRKSPVTPEKPARVEKSLKRAAEPAEKVSGTYERVSGTPVKKVSGTHDRVSGTTSDIREVPAGDVDYAAMAREALRAGSWARAEELYGKIAGSGSGPDAWYGLGRARFERGNVKGSINALGRALASKNDFHRARNLLGHAYLAMGKRHLAEKAWKKVLEMDPGNREAQKSLAALGGE